MKRLNLPALICLNSRILPALIPFSIFAGILFYVYTDADTILVFVIAGAAAFLLSILILFFLRLYPWGDERELIESADFPLWNELSDEDKRSLCPEKPMNFSDVLKWTAVILCLSIVFMYFARNDSIIFVIVVICMIMALLGMIFNLLDSSLWTDIDKTAVYTDIPVHHCFTKEYPYFRHRGMYYYAKSYSDLYLQAIRNKSVEHYAVCYLPDGKYIFFNDSGIDHPTTIRIVRYKGRYKTIIKK